MDEQEQREQYQQQLEYEREMERLHEEDYMEYCHNCYRIAEAWLLGECNDEEAETHLAYAGDNKGVLYWAEDVLKHTRMGDYDEIPF